MLVTATRLLKEQLTHEWNKKGKEHNHECVRLSAPSSRTRVNTQRDWWAQEKWPAIRNTVWPFLLHLGFNASLLTRVWIIRRSHSLSSPLMFAAMWPSCALLIYFLASRPPDEVRRRSNDDNTMKRKKERSIDRSRTSFSDSFSHSLERGMSECENDQVRDKQEKRAITRKREMLFVNDYERSRGGGLSVRWPWGADIIFKLIEIEYKQFIVHSSKHR